VFTCPKLYVKNINQVNFAHFWHITAESKGGKRTKTDMTGRKDER